ncbi:MAG: VCBS repeat-containing protein, partial [Bacteroidetes bacterium]|nr:VCBS repeat-containing protein [Bacteroidota bacterium]
MRISSLHAGLVTALVLLMNAGAARSQSFREVTSLLDVQSDPRATLFGASIVDINSDGLVDIYQPSRMYLQQPDGKFRHTMQEVGMDRDGYTVFGAVFADTDDGGFLDVFFMDIVADSSRFFSNVRGLWYERSNASVGIEIGGETQGSIFADFNGDGPIDLFVGDENGNNQLFLGSLEGIFTDATSAAGIVLPPHTYGAAAADYDGDGDLDIFIAACSPTPEYSVNLLFQNQGDGTFIDVAAFAGVDDDLGGWGVVWIDYDA